MIDVELERYAENHTSEEENLLYQLNRETHLKVLLPRMLSGKVQGKFLKFVSQMIQPKRILEIGTYTGYSALCLAMGLREDGELVTIDKNAELEIIASKYFQKSENRDKIRFISGDAMQVIPQLEGDFDLIFLDADKSNYLNYYKLLIDRVPKGGYILADNVLWSGKVVQELDPKDVDTKAILEFNQYVQDDPGVENVLLPFRDGLLLIKKL
ncbi:MAG: class I SAM-dependent methyltransferase [Bacteroidales bacterium]|nr:class I SAM-dependent methyltransferase [Bacteroidales bacterium]